MLFSLYFRSLKRLTQRSMNIFKSAEGNKWGNFLSQSLLIIVSVVVIVWFIPRETGTKYSYDVGKPWVYGSLIATFDFPVYKSEDSINMERSAVKKSFVPYYNLKTDVAKVQVARFREEFLKEGSPLPQKAANEVIERLHEYYSYGIVSMADGAKFMEDTTKMMRLVSGKTAISVHAASFLTTRRVYEAILADPLLEPYRQTLRKCDMSDYIEPNISIDKVRNEDELNDLLSSIAPASGHVITGQKIIDRGEMVDKRMYNLLSSWEKENTRLSSDNDNLTSTIVGRGIFVTIMELLFTLYLGLFRKDYFEKPRSIAMLYVMITIFPVLVSLMMKHNILSVYILPFAMTAIFIRVFMDSRTAFISHTIMVLICAAVVKYQYEFIIIQLVAGLVAIYSLRELSQRAQLFRTAVLVTLASFAVYLALQLMQDTPFEKIELSMYKYFVVNGVFLLFVYPMMLVVEKTFGFVSVVTLIELSNTSKELLRDLSQKAPGTFQHSIMVSNLAAEIAQRIGAKAQLVRTGALYHDIGKMQNPAFFTENQAGRNPLDDMSRQEAAKIVIAHVANGVRLAEKYNLPTVIKDFILTHHGTGITRYFYVSYVNEHPDEEVDKAPFTYPGSNPFTREQAVLMMADTVEAASHSLKEYTEEGITELVNRLIDAEVTDGFFRYCPITFHDIATAKQVLVERLKSIYHTRIIYPTLNKS